MFFYLKTKIEIEYIFCYVTKIREIQQIYFIFLFLILKVNTRKHKQKDIL